MPFLKSVCRGSAKNKEKKRQRDLEETESEVELPIASAPPPCEPPAPTVTKPSVQNLGKMFKELECPVCYNTCVPPIETCKNGHIICANCRACMNVCPTCRERFTGTRNFFAENFINQYAQPCRFKSDGCEFIRWKGENMAPHENTCQFRNVQCIVPSCSQSLPYRSLLDHLITEHKIAGSEKIPTIISYDVLDPIISSRKWLPYYIKAYDNVFFVMMEVTRPSFYIWVWVQECKKEALSVNCTYVTSMRFQSYDKTMVYNWEGPVHSIRTPSSTIKTNGVCLIIPESVMQHFERDSRISLLINIEKRKILVVPPEQPISNSVSEKSSYHIPEDLVPDEIFYNQSQNPTYTSLSMPLSQSQTTDNLNSIDSYRNINNSTIDHNHNRNFGPIPSQR